jgi:uncharacterized protein YjbI with pentapeptide repeats
VPGRSAFLAVGSALALLAGGASASMRATPACEPGSGPDFTHTDVTQSDLTSGRDVRCANLAGAYMQGFDLTQVDLEGANLQGANLEGADLGQATLTGATLKAANLANANMIQAVLSSAVLDGADLSHAKLGQVTADHASFAGANLTGVDFTQADLRDANLDHAKLRGSDFTQAEIGGATFHGATGITPWSLIIAIASGVVFVMLLVGPVRRAVTRGSPRALALGIAGALVVALGVHLFLGGLVEGFVGSFGAPVRQTCSTGPLCPVGVGFGIFGIWLGVAVVIAGFVVLAAAKRSTPPAAAPAVAS